MTRRGRTQCRRVGNGPPLGPAGPSPPASNRDGHESISKSESGGKTGFRLDRSPLMHLHDSSTAMPLAEPAESESARDGADSETPSPASLVAVFGNAGK